MIDDMKVVTLSPQVHNNGGRRGIRTPGAVSGSAVFKTAAFDHSAILPVIRVSYLVPIQLICNNFRSFCLDFYFCNLMKEIHKCWYV